MQESGEIVEKDIMCMERENQEQTPKVKLKLETKKLKSEWINLAVMNHSKTQEN